MKPNGMEPLITVQSSTVDLGDVLPEQAKANIRRMAAKYFGRLHTAAVHVNREGASFRCTVTLQIGPLKAVTAEALDPDCYRALDVVLEKVAKQLRRKKRLMREDKPMRVDKDVLLREGTRGS